MIDLCKLQFSPDFIQYVVTLAASVKDLKELGISADTQMEILSTIDTKLAELKKATAELEDIVAKAAEKEDDPKAWAKYYPAAALAPPAPARKPAAALEPSVDAKVRPFPTYEELLFEQQNMLQTIWFIYFPPGAALAAPFLRNRRYYVECFQY